MITNELLKPIETIINEVRSAYPIKGNEFDGKIYYMNGNDGTDFDWQMNNRLCEFSVFHENEMGYIRLLVNKDASITVYVYEDGGFHPTDTIETYKYPANVKDLYNLMYYGFDSRNVWDKPIED